MDVTSQGNPAACQLDMRTCIATSALHSLSDKALSSRLVRSATPDPIMRSTFLTALNAAPSIPQPIFSRTHAAIYQLSDQPYADTLPYALSLLTQRGGSCPSLRRTSELWITIRRIPPDSVGLDARKYVQVETSFWGRANMSVVARGSLICSQSFNCNRTLGDTSQEPVNGGRSLCLFSKLSVAVYHDSLSTLR